MNYFHFEEQSTGKKVYLNLNHVQKIEVVEKSPKMTINQIRITWSDSKVNFLDLADEQLKELLKKI